MNGSMLWFDETKEYGFILTDAEERIYVDRSGFLPGQVPVGRCAKRRVELNAVERDGKRVAVDVSMVPEADQRRARRRSSGYRSA